IAKMELMGVALGLDPDGGLNNVRNRGPRNAPVNPVNRHPLRRDVPDLLVVGNHILLGDTPAENMVHPLFEIGRGREVVMQIVVEALEAILRSQIVKPVLEGIFYQPALVTNPVVAPALNHIGAELPVNSREDFRIAREEDMRAANVKGITMLEQTLAVPAGPCPGLQHFVFVTAMAADHQSRQPSAQHADPHHLSPQYRATMV